MWIGISLFCGMLLGVVHFGGLWWTVNVVTKHQKKASFLLLSAFVRMTITLSGFYFVMDQHYERLLLCVAGFIFSRYALSFIFTYASHSSTEVSHARY